MGCTPGNQTLGEPHLGQAAWCPPSVAPQLGQHRVSLRAHPEDPQGRTPCPHPRCEASQRVVRLHRRRRWNAAARIAHVALIPPSTARTDPVTPEALPLQSHATASATSSGRIKRSLVWWTANSRGELNP